MKILPVKKLSVSLAIAGLLYLLSYVEYDNFKITNILFPAIWISIPFLIMKLLPANKVAKVTILTISILLYSACTFVFAVRFVLCGWGYHGTMYVNKKDTSIKISCRTYECYGTDGDCELFKERHFTNHLKWVTKFNGKPVDTTEWRHSRHLHE